MILQDTEAAGARAELRGVVDDLLASMAPASGAVARAEAAAEGRIHTELWTRLSRDVGVVGLAAAEQWGGSGATFAELAVVLEASGRSLTAVPLLGSWLAVEAIVRTGDRSAAETWLPALIAGSRSGAVAWPDSLPQAVADGDRWLLSGDLELIVDAVAADVLAVPAASPDGPILAIAGLEGVRRWQQESLDLTRQIGRLRLDGTPARSLELDGPVPEFMESLRDLAVTALACEQLGVAEQALADAVAYAREREQFGRAIGSFQAVKHLLADMATATDLARSLVEHAIWAASEHPEGLRAAAAMAQLQATRAACFVSAESVQIHGGIGFSWEHPAHLYFRKARSNATILGDRSFFSERLLAELGVTDA
jgi:acyl-CoA dehydrogenase